MEAAGRAAFGMASGTGHRGAHGRHGLRHGHPHRLRHEPHRRGLGGHPRPGLSATRSCPPSSSGQPLSDPLVLDALERWASAEAATVLGPALRGGRHRPRRGRGRDVAHARATRAPRDERVRRERLAAEPPGRAGRRALLDGGRVASWSATSTAPSPAPSADPWAATIVPTARRALRRLAARDGVEVVLLSGRTASDLAGRVRVGGIGYLGDHGSQRAMAPRGFRPTALHVAHEAVEPGRGHPRPPPGRRGARAPCPSPGSSSRTSAPRVTFHVRTAPDVDAARARVLAACDAIDHVGRPRALRAGAARWSCGRPAPPTRVRPCARLIEERRPGAVIALGDDHTDVLAFEALREARTAGRSEGWPSAWPAVRRCSRPSLHRPTWCSPPRSRRPASWPCSAPSRRAALRAASASAAGLGPLEHGLRDRRHETDGDGQRGGHDEARRACSRRRSPAARPRRGGACTCRRRRAGSRRRPRRR